MQVFFIDELKSLLDVMKISVVQMRISYIFVLINIRETKLVQTIYNELDKKHS